MIALNIHKMNVCFLRRVCNFAGLALFSSYKLQLFISIGAIEYSLSG